MRAGRLALREEGAGGALQLEARRHARIVPLCRLMACALLLAIPAVLFWSLATQRVAVAATGRDSNAKVQAQQELIGKLTREERAIHARLAKTEDELTDLQDKVERAEKDYHALQAEEGKLRQRLESLEREKDKTSKDLSVLLRGLWPVQIRCMIFRGRRLPAWEQADREFSWLSAIYTVVGEKQSKLLEQEKEVEQTLSRKREITAEARQRLIAVNADKDQLLAGRLGFQRSLSEVRQRLVDEEAELREIMATIVQVNYQLEWIGEDSGDKKETFKQAKGELPWPARGSLVQRFRPSGAQPSRGVGLALPAGTKIRAVSRGKVLHDDILRGFGRVVILVHNDGYYSLYAFLGSSQVRTGKEVQQGEVIGEAGFYPAANGPGLYFELRFHQKPINPELWLAAKK